MMVPPRVRELAADDAVLANLAGAMMSVIGVMTQEVDRPAMRVLDEGRVEPTCRHLTWFQSRPVYRVDGMERRMPQSP